MSINIRKPNDFHHHLRENDLLKLTTKECFNKFYNVIVMPNLKIPIVTLQQALEYRNKIKELQTTGNPLMTLYLNENISMTDLENFKNYPELIGIKYYPKSATTNSEFGINNLNSVIHILKKMELENIPLLVHGESKNDIIDIFDRENVFLNNELVNIIKTFPKLKIILEHISKKESVEFVIKHNIYATITPHHLILDRNDIFRDGINPHLYCLPILKRREDREILLQAALSGRKNFFLGTDSAPHEEYNKLSCCGCAGIFNSPVAVELITELFEKHNSLKNLEKFISTNGCDCYNLPYNEDYITLVKEVWDVPKKYENIVPLYAGKQISWKYKK
jgi:dihydroorotase